MYCRYQDKIKERRQERAKDEFEVNQNKLGRIGALHKNIFDVVER